MGISAPEDRQHAADAIRPIIAGSTLLEDDLHTYFVQPTIDPETAKHLQWEEARKIKQEDQRKKAKAAWAEFAELIRNDTSLLSESKNLESWQAGLFRFKHLLEWLQHRSKTDDEKALHDWRLLEEGFGGPVAEAFRSGLSTLWRLLPAKRPVHTDGNGISVSWMTILAFGAIAVEATEDPEWVSKLSANEAQLAAEHGCYSEQGYPEWLDPLVTAFPQVVLPVLRHELDHEWRLDAVAVTSFLQRFGSAAQAIQLSIQPLICSMMNKGEAGRLHTLTLAVSIVCKLELDENETRFLISLCRRRLANHRRAGRKDFALRYLAMLLWLDPERALADLIRWIESAAPSSVKDRAEETLGDLFDRHDPLMPGVLGRASITSLEKLLQLAYRHIRIADDVNHEDSYTPGLRDRAEGARNTILTAVMTRPGADAYGVIRRASVDPDFHLRADRFLELAKEKAEQDSELKQWKPAEIVRLERKHIAPIKTGEDLLRVVTAVLSDMKSRLVNGDVTSRPLLERAKDEDEVQHWLVEQINFLAKDRYHAHREAQVAGGDKPDVIVSSAAAAVQVAIEIKHGGKDWTVLQLQSALRKQLAVDYLKPEIRRHGVLVITNHRNRQWIDPTTKARISFDELIDHLSAIAGTITNNGFGEIIVKVVGLNAWLPIDDTPKKGTRRPDRGVTGGKRRNQTNKKQT